MVFFECIKRANLFLFIRNIREDDPKTVLNSVFRVKVGTYAFRFS